MSSFFFGRVLPQAVPLEEAVLGAIMLDKDALTVVIDILRPDSFYREEHQQIYRAMIRLFERSNPIDFFFFKQKTAYEMLYCDWSSDVCSSDLEARPRLHPAHRRHRGVLRGAADRPGGAGLRDRKSVV